MSENNEEQVQTTQAGLTPDTEYIARVRTIDKLGNPSGWADAVKFKTPALAAGMPLPEDNGPPGTPTGLDVQGGFGAILVNWTPNPEPDMQYGFGRYIVKIEDPLANIDTVELLTGATELYYTNPELVPGQDLNVSIKAKDPYDNESSYGAPITETLTLIDTGDLVDAMVLKEGQAIQSSDWPDDLGGAGLPVDTDVEDNLDTHGWRIESNGKAAFNDVRLRGNLVVKTLSTTNDPYVEGGIYLESSLEGGALNANNSIFFLHPDLGPPWPAQISSFVNEPDPPGEGDFAGNNGLLIHPYLGDDSEGLGRPKLYLINEESGGNMYFEGDDIYVNGVTLARPPLLVGQGVDTTCLNSTFTTLGLFGLAYHQTHNAAGDAFITLDTGSNTIRPLIPGWYTCEAVINYTGPTQYYGASSFLIGPNTGVGHVPYTLEASEDHGGTLASTHSIKGTFYFDGDLNGPESTVRIRALQVSGGSKTDIRVLRFEIKFASLP